MKQFSLEEYLKNPNRRIITRDGREARVICTNRSSVYPIVALVDNGIEDVYIYSETGICSEGRDKLDLFFPQRKREGWINIYKTSNGPIEGWVYDSKEEAKINICNNQDYIATCKIEWEE